MEDLMARLKKMGLYAYSHRGEQNVVTIVYGYTNPDYEIGQDTHNVCGETPFEIFEKITAWINDKKFWLEQDKYLVLDYAENPYNIDLSYELLKMGFKCADIELEETNFVAVDCRFCYINENKIFCYDGILRFDNVGNKFSTMEYIKVWVEKFSIFFPGKEFVPCKNKDI